MYEREPWHELRARDDVVCGFVDLGPAEGDAFVRRLDDGRFLIGLGSHLTRRERRAALAHELEHLRRGGGAAYFGQRETWRPVVRRDENAVDREVALRLVPQPELATLARVMDDMGEILTPELVCEHFDVPPDVAFRALTLLAQSSYGERSA
jgi:hypothetical protein